MAKTPDDAHLGAAVDGRYEILAKIDEGAMGAVYRARDRVEARDVAVKLLAPQLMTDAVFVERFRREGEAVRRVRHERIVEVYGSGVDGARAWIAMELLDGHVLSRRLAQGALPPREAVGVLRQVTEGLACVHDAGIVHRDVKPANVFLCRAEEGVRVKVLDFGLVRMLGEATLTASGQVVGTPEYMAPEQIQGRRCTPASDLYALGVVLFEMLTGRVPFKGSLTELFMLHSQAAAPRPSALVPTLPDALDGLVARLLTKDPALRPRDARRLLADLDALRPALDQ